MSYKFVQGHGLRQVLCEATMIGVSLLECKHFSKLGVSPVQHSVGSDGSSYQQGVCQSATHSCVPTAALTNGLINIAKWKASEEISPAGKVNKLPASDFKIKQKPTALLFAINTTSARARKTLQ